MKLHRNSLFPQSKKGIEKIPLLIFEVLFVVAVGWIAVNISTNYAQSQTVQQIRTAEEISMMVNTLVATPGESLVEYPNNLTQYRLVLTSSAIIISLTSGSDYDQVQRNFYLPTGYIAQTQGGIVEHTQHVCLSRKDRIITLQICPKPEVTK